MRNWKRLGIHHYFLYYSSQCSPARKIGKLPILTFMKRRQMFRGLGLGSSQPYNMTGRRGVGVVPGTHRALRFFSFVIFLFISYSPPFIPGFPLTQMRNQLPGWEPQSPVLLQSRGSVGTSGPGNKRLERKCQESSSVRAHLLLFLSKAGSFPFAGVRICV